MKEEKVYNGAGLDILKEEGELTEEDVSSLARGEDSFAALTLLSSLLIGRRGRGFISTGDPQAKVLGEFLVDLSNLLPKYTSDPITVKIAHFISASVVLMIERPEKALPLTRTFLNDLNSICGDELRAAGAL